VRGNDTRWIWYRRGEDNASAAVQSVKFPASSMVFAVIGVHYKSRLLVIEGPINTGKYIENCSELGFIEELDSIHGLEESCEVLQQWPPNSPDLSPIEMIRSIMKNWIFVLKSQTLDELKAAM
jgi:hypothetical protein